MFIPVTLFIFGLVLLVKGGDWFVDGATGVARRMRIPELLIGATVVSIGTTLPEVIFSATSAVGGHGEFAYGNAIGSIICNTALVAALTIIFRPSKIERRSLILPVIFFFSAAILYSLCAFLFGRFDRPVGIAFLIIFALYLASLIWGARGNKEVSVVSDSGSIGRSIFYLILGGALIAVGARLLVDNGTVIAEALGVPEAVIALTFVALGTSLPELVTAITSIVKGHGALALGNVIGANVLNLTLVCGVAATLSPFELPASVVFDIPIMLSVMAILTVPTLLRGKLLRYQGIILILIYACFCFWQFVI